MKYIILVLLLTGCATVDRSCPEGYGFWFDRTTGQTGCEYQGDIETDPGLKPLSKISQS